MALIYQFQFVVRCTISYHLYNLKNVKNTHGRVLILVKLQAEALTLLELTLLHGYFSRFLNCTNGTKSRNAQHLAIHVSSFTQDLIRADSSILLTHET